MSLIMGVGGDAEVEERRDRGRGSVLGSVSEGESAGIALTVPWHAERAGLGLMPMMGH